MNGSPEYLVEVRKSLTFAVRADSSDEARALAVLVATGDASLAARARVRCTGRQLAVESCHAPEGPA